MKTQFFIRPRLMLNQEEIIEPYFKLEGYFYAKKSSRVKA